MENIFNNLINSYLENNIGIENHFLSTTLAFHLSENLAQLYSEDKMAQAGMGSQNQTTHDKLYRSDKIYWLDRNHDNVYENEFLSIIDSFVKYLNESCYTGITGYEFHYTLYEKGSFYKKHIDQFRGNDSRKFSVILYLNENWLEQDGGELCIYNESNVIKISPNTGKCVFFKSSELLHEVLECNRPRMSITGWLKS